MADLGALVIKIGADTAAFEHGIRRVQGQVERWGSDLQSAAGQAALAFKLLGAAAASLTAATVGLAVASAKTGDEFAKLSAKTGETVETLSALSFAAKLSNVPIEGLQVGLRHLAVQMSQGASGSGEAAKAFRELGVQTQTATGQLRPTGEVLLAVADRFAGMRDAAQRAALAQQLFGRSGVDLLPLLNQGSAAIKTQMEEARQLGGVWSTEAAQGAQTFMDNLQRLEVVGKGFLDLVGRELIPVVNEIALSMLQWVKNNRQLLEQQLVEWARALGQAMKDMATILQTVAPAMETIGVVAGLIGRAVMIAGRIIAIFMAMIIGTVVHAGASWSAFLEKIPLIGTAFRQATADLEAFRQRTFTSMQANSAKLLQALGLMAEQEVKIMDEAGRAQEALGKAIVDRLIKAYRAGEEEKTRISQAGAAARMAIRAAEGKAEEALGRTLVSIAQRENAEAAEASRQLAEAEIHNQLSTAQAGVRARAEQLAAEAKAEQALGQFTQDRLNREWRASQEVTGFWNTQLTDLVASNVFSLSAITTAFTNATANWMLGLGTFKQFWQGLQVSLLQTALQLGVQWAAAEALRATATVAANTTIAASNTATAAVSASAMTGAITAIGAAIVGMGAAVIASLKAVWLIAKAVLQAIANAMKVSLFGIIVGVAITAALVAGAIMIAEASREAAALLAAGALLGGLSTGLALADFLGGVAAAGSFADIGFVAAQHGGLFTKPTLAMLGEAGPEAVIPLSRAGMDLGGDQHITVYLDRLVLTKAVLRGRPRVAALYGVG